MNYQRSLQLITEKQRSLYFVVAAILICLCFSCSLFDPKLEVQVGLSNSDSTYGFFNFGSTLENIGNGTAFNVESELELFGSNPGSYQTLYTIASGSLVVPKSVLNSGESTLFGLVGTATTWIARSYILTITYQNESGKNCDPTIVQGYFTMK